MNQPVLLLGARGMLGQAWTQRLGAAGAPFDAPGRDRVDLQNLGTLEALELGTYRAVINCAAYTEVDAAEADEARATLVNGEAVLVLAERCARAGIPLVHYSTDYVFAGDGTTPYAIDHARAPMNAYGRSKLAGELAIEASGCAYLLVRTSWVYAAWGKNFVRTIASAAEERPELRVVDDQRGRPTSALHLAEVSSKLLDLGVGGTFHVTDGAECTWFDFASEIVRQRRAPAVVNPCSSAEYVRAAKRPAYSVLDISRAESLVGAFPTWQANLAAVLAELPSAK